jgi:hypothetical protein
VTAAEETEIIEIDLIEIDVTIDIDERARRRRHAYSVTIKAPAGFAARFRVHPHEHVETLTRHAIRHFTARGELREGAYDLEKVEGASTVPLTSSATLQDSGVGRDAVCVLVVAGPQVDG